MARKDTKVDRLEAIIADDAIEVEHHDKSALTFDLVLADKRIRFVDGKAIVDAATAKALKDGGYVK